MKNGVVITQELLKSMFDYNPETGCLIVRATGKEAGYVEKVGNGYRRIKIRGKKYYVHRIVYMYVYGSWPKGHIDHIDGDGLNNRIANLRNATPRDNSSNLRKHREGKLIGASYYKRTGKWISSIRVNIGSEAKLKFLGYFSTALEAHQAYMKERMAISNTAFV